MRSSETSKNGGEPYFPIPFLNQERVEDDTVNLICGSFPYFVSDIRFLDRGNVINAHLKWRKDHLRTLDPIDDYHDQLEIPKLGNSYYSNS